MQCTSSCDFEHRGNCAGPIHFFRLNNGGHWIHYYHACDFHGTGAEMIHHDNDRYTSGTRVLNKGHTDGTCLTCQYLDTSNDDSEEKSHS